MLLNIKSIQSLCSFTLFILKLFSDKMIQLHWFLHPLQSKKPIFYKTTCDSELKVVWIYSHNLTTKSFGLSNNMAFGCLLWLGLDNVFLVSSSHVLHKEQGLQLVDYWSGSDVGGKWSFLSELHLTQSQ